MIRKILAALVAVISVSFSPVEAPIAYATELGTISGRWCGSGYIGWNDFGSMRQSLDSWYPRKGRIWSVPSDDQVWEVWCHVTKSKGRMREENGILQVQPKVVFLEDATRLDFRTKSLSGGYTIDINTREHTKNFKVHVAR